MTFSTTEPRSRPGTLNLEVDPAVSKREKWLFYLIFALVVGSQYVLDRPAPQRLNAALVFLGIVGAAILVTETLNWCLRKRS
jgi:hypothetical protein